MMLVVGLGNPGKKYENTRHNLGFFVIDQLVKQLGIELNKTKFNGLYYQTKEFTLLKPQTYMNNSGECVASFINYFKISVDDLLVLYDDVALPLGNFRYRQQGSDGGHNGIKNIIGLLRTKKFKRLRIGIGCNRNYLLQEWVLGEFCEGEKKEIKNILPLLLNSLKRTIEGENFEKIMNEYNRQ